MAGPENQLRFRGRGDGGEKGTDLLLDETWRPAPVCPSGTPLFWEKGTDLLVD